VFVVVVVVVVVVDNNLHPKNNQIIAKHMKIK
jgi:hypothetical protein